MAGFLRGFRSKMSIWRDSRGKGERQVMQRRAQLRPRRSAARLLLPAHLQHIPGLGATHVDGACSVRVAPPFSWRQGKGTRAAQGANPLPAHPS